LETYKILTGPDRVEAGRMFRMVGVSRTRDHSLRKRGRLFRTEMRKRFFTQRVVGWWNSLPHGAVETKILYSGSS